MTVTVLLIALQGCSTRYIVPSPEYTDDGSEANQHSRLIDAPRHRLFQIITDETQFRQICPEGTIVGHEDPLPYQVGTVIRTTIDHIFTLNWQTQVVEITPNRKIRLRFLDGFFAGGTELWELRQEDRGTRISHTIIVNPKGLIRTLIWHLKVRGKHDRMVEIVLDNLQTLCETS